VTPAEFATNQRFLATLLAIAAGAIPAVFLLNSRTEEAPLIWLGAMSFGCIAAGLFLYRASRRHRHAECTLSDPNVRPSG
jgi:hypothetical protein